MTEPLTLYNVGTKYKLPEGERTIYDEVADPEQWIEQHSERVPEGEPTRYAQWLTERAAERFTDAENFDYIEAAERTWPAGLTPPDADLAPYDLAEIDAMYRLGVERAALEFARFFGLPEGVAKGNRVLVGVADTGYGETDYTRGRTEAVWTWYNDDGRDRHGHGTWCMHAALPMAAELISMKVLSDRGSGSTAYSIAAADRFIDYCEDHNRRGVLSYSLGSESPSTGYDRAGKRALDSGRVLPIAAAGNQGRTDGVHWPAKSRYWMSVGAVDHHNGRIASFSNRLDGQEPDVYAPGVLVGGEGGDFSGTSMATPIDARGAVKLMSVEGANGRDVWDAITRSARKKNQYGGAGLLTLDRAYAELTAATDRR